jgi:pantoate--beta-alanine ligase
VKTVRTIPELRAALAGTPAIGLVPTMGAFHEGHLSLFRAARAENPFVVASLFVNPAQFDEQADLAAYPRNEARDLRLAEDAGIDLVFAPAADEMYPPGYETWVAVEGLGARLEGEYRPGHFRGVATVCLKLFNLVRPHRAYFGQKDAQQVVVLQRLIQDLNLEMKLRVLPIVRDPDGLALSSRNALLSRESREEALALPRALAAGAEADRRGRDAVAATRARLNGLSADYVGVLAAGNARVLVAAVHVREARLIDNVLLEGELP